MPKLAILMLEAWTMVKPNRRASDVPVSTVGCARYTAVLQQVWSEQSMMSLSWLQPALSPLRIADDHNNMPLAGCHCAL